MPSITDNLNLFKPDPGQSGVAAELNGNWDQLDFRFDEAGGHTHDGTPGQGPKVPVTSLATTGTPSATTYLRGDGLWTTGTGSGSGVTDHADLTGLTDDDHPQYHNQSRGDARYAQRANNLSDLANTATARTNLGAAATVHQHAAADVSTGTIATARLGSGTPSTTTFLRGDQTWAVPGAGGSVNLDDLADVLITSPADNQVLSYDAAGARWINEAPTGGGGGTLDALTDTTITTPSDNQVLTYDSTTSQWRNETPPVAGSVATDVIWDAAGDLAVGSGANTAARLALGASGTVLTSTGSAAAWQAPVSGSTIGGFVPYVYPPYYAVNAALSAAFNLTAAGGTAITPLVVPATMTIESLTIRNSDGTLTRSMEWRLYQQSSSGSGILDHIAGLNGTDTFTAGTASNRTSTAATPTAIGPGLYWLAIRNTEATNTWGLGGYSTTAAQGGMALMLCQQKSAVAALTSTLDAATGWTKNNNILAVRLNGRVFGLSTAF